MDLTPIFNQAWSRKAAVALVTIIVLYLLAIFQPTEETVLDSQIVRLGLYLVAIVGIVAIAAQGLLDYLRPGKNNENGDEQKTPKPPTVVPLLLLGSLLLLPGCGLFPSNPRAQLLASQKTFVATVDSLTALQQAGKFSQEETERLTVLIHAGQQYLNEWQTAVQAGQSHPDVIQSFQTVLDTLIEYNLQKGGAP